jgi:hypothetical protein
VLTSESDDTGRDQLEALQLVAAKKLTNITTLIVTRQRRCERRSPRESVSLSPTNGNGSEVVSDVAEFGCDGMGWRFLESRDGETAEVDDVSAAFSSASFRRLRHRFGQR